MESYVAILENGNGIRDHNGNIAIVTDTSGLISCTNGKVVELVNGDDRTSFLEGFFMLADSLNYENPIIDIGELESPLSEICNGQSFGNSPQR